MTPATPEAVIQEAEKIVERQWTRHDRHQRMEVAGFLFFAIGVTLAWITLLVMGAIWLLS
jgi:hypothetical protein